MSKQGGRFAELEGLRGVAAVMVAVYHFLLAFYIVLFFGSGGDPAQHLRIEDNLYGTPLTAPLSGTLMVAIFFVLSGFVLSIGFFQTGKASIVKKLAAKRYLRLMLPALASILFAFVLISVGLVFLKDEVGVITQSDWLQRNWQFTPNLFTAIQSGMYEIFVERGNVYNNVLWTMVYEFMGSFLVFGSLLLFGKVKYRWVFYTFLLFATFNTWFFAFIIGMLMADLYASKYLTNKRFGWVGLVVTVGLVMLFGGYPLDSVKGTIYEYLTFSNFDIDWMVMYLTIAAALCVGAVLFIKQLTLLFQNRFLSGLGKYTFALYLVHVPIIYTFSMAAFLLFKQQLGLGYNWSVVLSLVASIPVVTLATVLFERYVDAPSIRLSSYVANILLGYKEPTKIKEWAKGLIDILLRPPQPRQPSPVSEEVEVRIYS